MARFLLGDDLGSLKVLHYLDEEGPSGSKVEVKNVYRSDVSFQGETRIAVQALAVLNTGEGVLVAAAFSNGNLQLSRLDEDDTLATLCSWTEPRLKNNRFVGIALTDRAVISCTSNGALRRVNYTESNGQTEITNQTTRALPTRLCDWKLSPNGETFAYGGEEVALSLWNTEKAFGTPAPKSEATSNPKKRKRKDVLFPGEIWRAKNPPNDSLNLRQPIRITTLDFIPSSGTSHTLVVGSQSGNIQCYDTRAAHRPVAEWKSICKGGVRTLKTGCNENELFVSDNGSNVYSIDLRNGKILYAHHGIAGSVSCIAATPEVVISASLDQFARVHSVVAPPQYGNERTDNKGTTLEKHFLQCTPTKILWDTRSSSKDTPEEDDAANDSDRDVWDNLKEVSADDDSAPKPKRRHVSNTKKPT